MPTIHRISDLTIERRGGSDPRLYVRFKINQPPDRAWIDLFKAHAASSVYGATNVIIFDGDVSVEVSRPSSAAELATAVDCFIECANLRLRSFPTTAQPPSRPGPALRPRESLFGGVRPRRSP
jgi:hypothetical protein